MEIREKTTGGVLFWTPAPACTSSNSSVISEEVWEEEEEEDQRTEQGDDFTSLMDENGIIGLAEALVEEKPLCSVGPPTPAFADASGFETDTDTGLEPSCEQEECLNVTQEAGDVERRESSRNQNRSRSDERRQSESNISVVSTPEPADISIRFCPSGLSPSPLASPLFPHLCHFTPEEMAGAAGINSEVLPDVGFTESLTESYSSATSRRTPRPHRGEGSPTSRASSDLPAESRRSSRCSSPAKSAQSWRGSAPLTGKRRQGSSEATCPRTLFLRSSKAMSCPTEAEDTRKTHLSGHLPNFSQVEPRVRFPKGVYKPPKSKHSAKVESLSPEPALVFKSPADIVKEVLLNGNEGATAEPLDSSVALVCTANSIVPEDFKSQQHAIALIEQLQEEHNRLLIKYAAAENTIDRLRLGAKVNLYSDPPPSGVSMQLGQTPMALNVMTLDFPQCQRAELTPAPPQTDEDSSHQISHSPTSTSMSLSVSSCWSPEPQVGPKHVEILHNQTNKLLNQIQSFEDILHRKKLKPSQQRRGLSKLFRGLDSLERSYLLVRDQHKLQLQQQEQQPELYEKQQQEEMITYFDPERELEGLIFQCGQQLDELKDRVEQRLQQQSSSEAPPSLPPQPTQEPPPHSPARSNPEPPPPSSTQPAPELPASSSPQTEIPPSTSPRYARELPPSLSPQPIRQICSSVSPHLASEHPSSSSPQPTPELPTASSPQPTPELPPSSSPQHSHELPPCLSPRHSGELPPCLSPRHSRQLPPSPSPLHSQEHPPSPSPRHSCECRAPSSPRLSCECPPPSSPRHSSKRPPSSTPLYSQEPPPSFRHFRECPPSSSTLHSCEHPTLSPLDPHDPLPYSSPRHSREHPPPSSPLHSRECPPSASPRHSHECPPSASPRQSRDHSPSSSPRESHKRLSSLSPRHSCEHPPSSSPRQSHERLRSSSPRHSRECPPSSSPLHSYKCPPSSSPRHSKESPSSSSPRHSKESPPSSSPRHSYECPPSSSPRHSRECPPPLSPRHSRECPPSSSPHHFNEHPTSSSSSSSPLPAHELPFSSSPWPVHELPRSSSPRSHHELPPPSPALSPMTSRGGKTPTHPQANQSESFKKKKPKTSKKYSLSKSMPLSLPASHGSAADVRWSSEKYGDEDTDTDSIPKSVKVEPSNAKLKCDEEEMDMLSDDHQSFEETSEVLDYERREGAALSSTLTDSELGHESRGNGNAASQKSFQQRSTSMRSSRTVSDRQDASERRNSAVASRKRSSRSSISSCKASGALPENAPKSSSSRRSEPEKSPSSSLNSLRESVVSERRANPQAEHRRVLSQDGIFSPETDSGFVGSDSSRLNRAALPLSSHQRALTSIASQEVKHQASPASVLSPVSSRSSRRTTTEPSGASRLRSSRPGRSREAEEQSSVSRSTRHWASHTHQYTTDSEGSESGMKSDTQTPSEYEQSDQYAESFSSLCSPGLSSSSPTSQYLHGDGPTKALSSSQVACSQDAMRSLQAEVSRLKEKLETSLRSRSLLGSGAASSSPHARSRRQTRETSEGRSRGMSDEVTSQRRVSRKSLVSTHRQQSQCNASMVSEPQQPVPLLRVSRHTQTSIAESPDSDSQHSPTVCSRKTHSREDPSVCAEDVDGGRSQAPTLRPPSSSPRAGQSRHEEQGTHVCHVSPLVCSCQESKSSPAAPAGGTREASRSCCSASSFSSPSSPSSPHIRHCPLCGRSQPWTKSDCHESAARRATCQVESLEKTSMRNCLAATSPPALLPCVPLCPDSVLWHSQPALVSPIKSPGSSSGPRDPTEPRRRSASADKHYPAHTSMHSDLDKAVRAAVVMKHTTKHMVRALAAGLHYQELLSQFTGH